MNVDFNDDKYDVYHSMWSNCSRTSIRISLHVILEFILAVLKKLEESFDMLDVPAVRGRSIRVHQVAGHNHSNRRV